VRALAEDLQRRFGQPFVVENRPGGAFNIGARACAEAPPDGYTLCILPGEPLVFNQFLFKSLGFDPENGFAPVTQLFFITQALVVSAALKVSTLPELVALARAKPGTLSYSTAAVPLGVFMERLKKETGADLVRVPFRGGGEAVTALLNGSTPVGLYGLANVRSHLESGAVVGLLVDSEQRSALFPDIPTIAEATHKPFAGRSYFGLLGPAGLPRPIIEQLQGEISKAMEQPDFRSRNLIERGLEPVGSTPDEFARFLRQDRMTSAEIVRETGLTPQ
jgi:tripartite-type tricarboxylate transporter receptor subunit TctC